MAGAHIRALATMIFGLLRKRADPMTAAAETMHAAVVSASRDPALFRDLGAPDTLPGRFELIVLHASLALRRLRRDGPEGAGLGQALFDATFRTLEANLREIGVGDISVPKRMKAMARSFYDGAKAYDAALEGSDDARLASELARIVYAGAPSDPNAPARLAAYVRRADAALAQQDRADLVANGPAFPPPAETTS